MECQDKLWLTELVQEHLPKIVRASIMAHNSDVEAHKSLIDLRVEQAVNRMKIWVLASVFAGGVGGGVGLSKFLGLLGS